MPYFLNPFAKHDVSEFPGVFQPLSEAHRNPSVVAAHEAKFGKEDSSDKDVEDGKLDISKESSSLGVSKGVNQYSAYTVEGLKAEIDADLAAFGHDTVYDRTFRA